MLAPTRATHRSVLLHRSLAASNFDILAGFITEVEQFGRHFRSGKGRSFSYNWCRKQEPLRHVRQSTEAAGTGLSAVPFVPALCTRITMSLPSGIKRRGNTYSARYVLPRSVQRIACRHDLVQALGTNSLADAVALAAPIIAGWKAWAVAIGKGDAEHGPEVYVRRAEVAHRLIRDGIDH